MPSPPSRTKARPALALAAGAIAAALSLGAPTADASTVWVRDGTGGTVFDGGPGWVGITITVNGVNQSVAAGAFALQYAFAEAAPAGNSASWTNFLTYCLEPDELLAVSGTPRLGSFVEGVDAAAPYADTAAALTRFVNTWYADSLTSATRSAAFQVALWEIAHDGAANLATGGFRFTQAGATADMVRTQAIAYLNQANWVAGGDNLDVILRTGNQDLIIRIPEPPSLALLAAGLLGLCVVARRRRDPA